MSDPILDEDYIRGLLSVPVTAENISALQAGAIQALCDIYDRKVTRDEFTESAAACLVLHSQCSKLWMLHSIKDPFDDGALTAEMFVTTDKGMCDLIRRQAEKVIEIVKRLQLCPTSKDPVH